MRQISRHKLSSHTIGSANLILSSYPGRTNLSLETHNAPFVSKEVIPTPGIPQLSGKPTSKHTSSDQRPQISNRMATLSPIAPVHQSQTQHRQTLPLAIPSLKSHPVSIQIQIHLTIIQMLPTKPETVSHYAPNLHNVCWISSVAQDQ